MLDSLSPARRRFLVAVGALAAVLLLVVVLAVVRRQVSSGTRPVAQDAPGPVLVVPGYGGSAVALTELVAALRSADRAVTVVTLPGDGTGDLDDQAAALGAAAEAALETSGAESVDVVGYSAGGVVARLWVKEHGGAGLARRVVTLGSPHHGTTSAGLAVDLTPEGCPPACVELAPDSDLVRRLNAGDETPAGPVFVSIWSSTDQVVTPAESARLDGAINVVVQTTCNQGGVAHSDLPRVPVVIALVMSELTAAPATPPSAADCGSG